MNDRLKETLANLHDLATRGATEGEKKAARKAMERIIKKYNLKDINFDELRRKEYRFKYTSKLEIWLLLRLRDVMLDERRHKIYRSTFRPTQTGRYIEVRDIVMNLDELDYITMECAYEYFRRHMKKQWNKFALPILKRCRKSTTRNKKRELLQEEFFQQYCIASKLYKDGELADREITSQAEAERARAFRGIEGGEFNKQVNNGLYLKS